MTGASLDPELLAAITPVVLVGGRSERFGRDKLREPIDPRRPDEWIIDRPVAALRAVFGDRVAAVGECHPLVSARFDRIIADPYPGTGPMGGILAALEHAQTPVFVLAGDLPSITEQCVRRIAVGADEHSSAPAAIACTDRDHHTIGLYSPSLIGPLGQAIASGQLALHRLLREHDIARIELDPACARNINAPEDLPPGRRH